jgi:glutamyl-tRNA reductase
VQGKRIEVVTDLMRNRSKEIQRASQLLDSCFGRIDAVVDALETMESHLESDHPGLRQKYDEAEIERLYSTSYTTEREREVLRATLHGTVLSSIQQCSMGNGVELF